MMSPSRTVELMIAADDCGKSNTELELGFEFMRIS